MPISVDPESLHGIRARFRRLVPAVSSGHAAEALAASLGHSSSIALRTAMTSGLAPATASPDAEAFVRRLTELGCREEPGYLAGQFARACANADPLRSAAPAWPGSIDPDATDSRLAMQYEFLRLLEIAASAEASIVRIAVSPSGGQVSMYRDGMADRFADIPARYGHALLLAAHQLADTGDVVYSPGEDRTVTISGRYVKPFPEKLQSVRLEFSALRVGLRLTVRLNGMARASRDGGPDLLHLGFSQDQADILTRLVDAGSGGRLAVVSGSTGSGRTTSLSGLLGLPLVRGAHVRCLPEGELLLHEMLSHQMEPGSGQGDLNVTVADVRTRETALRATEALGQGDTVLMHLHANSVLNVFRRFRDLGMDLSLLPPGRTVLVHQSLVRRVCPHCGLHPEEARRRGLAGVDADLVAQLRRIGSLSGVRMLRPEGCDRCRYGAKGRELVAEVMEIDAGILEMAAAGDLDAVHAHWLATAGGVTIQERAVQKMFAGMLDPRDVEDKTGDLGDLDLARRGIVLGEG